MRSERGESAGTVSAYYAINGGSFVQLSASLQLSGHYHGARFTVEALLGIWIFS